MKIGRGQITKLQIGKLMQDFRQRSKRTNFAFEEHWLPEGYGWGQQVGGTGV